MASIGRPLIDMSGVFIGEIFVVERDGSSRAGNALWRCRCFCGREFIVSGSSLRTKAPKSCGCITNQLISKSRKGKPISHGDTVGGASRLYTIWQSMKDRCTRPQNMNYHRYGGRGIAICDEWLRYENFKKWSVENGYNDTLTIDRVDNDAGYAPGNCKWVPFFDNQQHKSTTIDINGHSLKGFCRKNNIGYEQIKRKLRSRKITIAELSSMYSEGAYNGN